MRTILITAITVTFVLSCKNKKETENSMSTNENKTPKIENTELLSLRKLMEYKLLGVWENQKELSMMVQSKRFTT